MTQFSADIVPGNERYRDLFDLMNRISGKILKDKAMKARWNAGTLVCDLLKPRLDLDICAEALAKVYADIPFHELYPDEVKTSDIGRSDQKLAEQNVDMAIAQVFAASATYGALFQERFLQAEKMKGPLVNFPMMSTPPDANVSYDDDATPGKAKKRKRLIVELG